MKKFLIISISAILGMFTQIDSSYAAGNCGIGSLDTSIAGRGTSYYGYTRLTGDVGSNESNYGLAVGSGQWATEFSYGTVWGMAKCSSTSGDNSSSTWPESSKSDWLKTPSDTTGQYCWCQATGFTPSGNSYTSGPQCTTIASSLWVFSNDNGSSDYCAHRCALNCASYVRKAAAFRAAVFGAVPPDPTVSLNWYDNYDNGTVMSGGPSACVVGGTFTPPTPPARPGYIFAGWKAHVPPNTCGLENNTAAKYGWDAYASVAIDGESCFWRDWDTLGESEWCEGEVFDGMAPGTWWDSNSVGTIYGEALCSSTSGQNCKSGTPDTNSTGGNCWCRSVSYKPNGGDLCVFAPTPSWIFVASWGASCSSLCAQWCSSRSINAESGDCKYITWGAIVQ